MTRTRRNHGAAFKAQVALVACKGDKTLVALAEARGRVSGLSGAVAKLGHPPSTLESKIRSLKISKHRFKPI